MNPQNLIIIGSFSLIFLLIFLGVAYYYRSVIFSYILSQNLAKSKTTADLNPKESKDTDKDKDKDKGKGKGKDEDKDEDEDKGKDKEKFDKDAVSWFKKHVNPKIYSLEENEIFATYYILQYFEADNHDQIDKIVKERYKDEDTKNIEARIKAVQSLTKSLEHLFNKCKPDQRDKEDEKNLKEIELLLHSKPDVKTFLEKLKDYKSDKSCPKFLVENIKKKFPDHSKYFDFKKDTDSKVTFLESFIFHLTEVDKITEKIHQ